jgi:hypothetical protein
MTLGDSGAGRLLRRKGGRGRPAGNIVLPCLAPCLPVGIPLQVHRAPCGGGTGSGGPARFVIPRAPVMPGLRRPPLARAAREREPARQREGRARRRPGKHWPTGRTARTANPARPRRARPGALRRSTRGRPGRRPSHRAVSDGGSARPAGPARPRDSVKARWFGKPGGSASPVVRQARWFGKPGGSASPVVRLRPVIRQTSCGSAKRIIGNGLSTGAPAEGDDMLGLGHVEICLVFGDIGIGPPLPKARP